MAADELDNDKIIFGGSVSLDFTKEFSSFGEFISLTLSAHGDKVAFIDGDTDRQLTYNEIKDGSLKLVAYFNRLGVGKGDIIGIVSENGLEFPLMVYGAFLVGATVVTCNPTYTAKEFEHAFGLVKPTVIFASQFAIKNVRAAAQGLPFIKTLIQLGPAALVPNVTLFTDIFNDSSLIVNPDYEAPPANMLDDVALIMFSSGTTGLPKGVQITQANIFATIANSIEARKNKVMEEEMVLLSIIPWFHSYGLLTMIHITAGGFRLILLPRFEPNAFLRSIQKYRITHGLMVPPLMVFMAKHPLVDQYDLSSLQELFCGSAPLSRDTEMAVLKRIPNLKGIRQGYGMSETTIGVTTAHDDAKPGSVGTINEGIYCKVIDPETGKILGANERGELCFKGNIIMKGYFGDEASTRQTIDKDGWLHSGDVGYYDDSRQFFIVDRLKELIKYKGFQVAPAELESILLTHPGVQDAAVIGKPDEASGELPLAFVVKRPEATVTEQDIQAFVASNVSHSKHLRGGVRFIDEIPKNLSGKILRRELRDLLAVPKSKL